VKDSPFTARLVQLAFLTAAITAWYVAGLFHAIPPLFLPPIDAVWSALNGLIRTEEFWSAVGVTLSTIARAYGIAVGLGVLAGYLVTRSRFLTAVLEPIISALFSIPITLFLPLFILLFGIGTASKVAYGAAYGFFPIALNTIAGFANVDELYLRASRAMGASSLAQFRYVYLPAALPVTMTGLRIGFFICIAAVLGGETLGASAGVGRATAPAAELMETARLYAWIAFVVTISVTLNLLVLAVESRSERE